MLLVPLQLKKVKEKQFHWYYKYCVIPSVLESIDESITEYRELQCLDSISFFLFLFFFVEQFLFFYSSFSSLLPHYGHFIPSRSLWVTFSDSHYSVCHMLGLLVIVLHCDILIIFLKLTRSSCFMLKKEISFPTKRKRKKPFNISFFLQTVKYLIGVDLFPMYLC